MKRLIALTLAVLLSGCGLIDPDQYFTVEITAVTESGEPLSGVKVTVVGDRDPHGVHRRKYEGVTGTDGIFSTSVLDEGWGYSVSGVLHDGTPRRQLRKCSQSVGINRGLTPTCTLRFAS